MTKEECENLIRSARTVLERYLFDADGQVRDDVAEICIKIDDAFPIEGAQERVTMADASMNESVQAAVASA